MSKERYVITSTFMQGPTCHEGKFHSGVLDELTVAVNTLLHDRTSAEPDKKLDWIQSSLSKIPDRERLLQSSHAVMLQFH